MTSENQSQGRLDFTTFVLSISSAAFYSLTGEGEIPVDLVLARQNIDLLELMYDKTRGNLTAEEKALLEQLLFEVRMKFVEVQSLGPSGGGSTG